jgi:hypothetical protein
MHEYIRRRTEKYNTGKRIENKYETYINIDMHFIAESKANNNDENDKFQYIFYIEMVLLDQVQAVETVKSKDHVVHVNDPVSKFFKKSEYENNQEHRREYHSDDQRIINLKG